VNNTRYEHIDDWQRLYDSLFEALKTFGKSDAFGDGDFWLVDDDWEGAANQKLIVFNVRCLTKQLVTTISKSLLELELFGTSVLVSLELKQLNGEFETKGGLVIYASGFEEFWDYEALRKAYGDAVTFHDDG
jgi:hypothetical protein